MHWIVKRAYSCSYFSDESQSLLSSQGPLARLEHFKGLYRISLLPPIERGQWRLQARSNGHLTFKVIGKALRYSIFAVNSWTGTEWWKSLLTGNSSVDFLYYFATANKETHPGLARVEGNPVAGKSSGLSDWHIDDSANQAKGLCSLFHCAGVSAFLVLSVTGLSPDENSSFTHVTLLGAEGDEIRHVWLNSSSSLSSVEELMGWLDSVPRVPFCIRLTGKDGRGNKLERISTEMVQPTHVQIQVMMNDGSSSESSRVSHIVSSRSDDLKSGCVPWGMDTGDSG